YQLAAAAGEHERERSREDECEAHLGDSKGASRGPPVESFSTPRFSRRAIPMKRKAYGRDAGLSIRMLFAGGLLGLLYVVFAVVLFQVLNVGLIPMIVIVIG